MGNQVEYGIRINLDGDRTATTAIDQVAASTKQLDATFERAGSTMGAVNGQMNDTAAIMRKNAEANNAASEAAQKFLAPLQKEIELFGASRAEVERYNAAQAGLSLTTQRQAVALANTIDAMKRDEDAARSLAASQDQATRAADAFLKKLNEQVATLGMNAQQLQTYRAAQLGVSDAAAPMIARLAETGDGAHTAGKHMEGLNFQTVAAKRELLVLAHELSQGNYQKFGGSMMVLGEQTGAAGLLFSAAGLAAIGLIATLGSLAYAVIKGSIEQKHMNDALIMTGNYAGLTSDSLNALAHSAVEAGGSIGEAKKVATELAGSGKFTGDQIGYITAATVAWEHATGQSVKSIIKDFESLAVQTTGNTMRATEVISRATVKLDDQYHFLTEAVYEQIRALEKEGDAKGASALATETFAKVTNDRAEEILHNLGSIARAWNAIKKEVGDAIDAVGNWGKRETPALNVTKYRDQLDALDKQIAARDKAAGREPGTGKDRTSTLAAEERMRIVLQLTDAVDKLNQADAAAIAQGKATLAQSQGVHAASRIAADDARLQKKGMSELQIALNAYADDVAKVRAANPDSPLVTEEAIAAGIAARTKAHQANLKGNDDRAKTLQDALVLEQTALDREKSIYDARDKMLSLYHSKFGTSDAEYYAGRMAARAEYIAAEAVTFAKESSLIQGYKPKNAEEVAANKEKYDQLLKQHLKFVDDMRNAGGEDSATAEAAAKKSYDDIVKATHDAGVAEAKRLDDAIVKQRAHNAEIGKTKEQIDLARQATVDLDTAQLQADADFIRSAMEKAGFDDKAQAVYKIRLNDLDEEVKRRRILAGLLGEAAVLDANAKAATEAGKAWRKTSDTIQSDLTNAILDGGGKGMKKLIRDMEYSFARLVLSPIMQPIANGVASLVNPGAAQAGGGSAAGSALGSVASSLMGGASIFGAGGLAGSVAAGAGWLTGATTLTGSLTAAGSLAATGTLGGIASSLGMVAGALGPIALGIGAAVALYKHFDTGGTEHTGGAASASSAGVSQIDSSPIGFHLPQRSTQADAMVSGLASGIVSILDSAALSFGKTAGYTAATAFADDSSKDGAWGALLISKLGEKVVNWQDTQTSRWAPKEFADGAAGQAQYLAALSTSVRTALDQIGLPAWAKTMLDGLGAGASIEDIAKVVDSINATQRALVVLKDNLVGFAAMGEDATSALIAASGGIAALSTNASAYFNAFYTESEKSASTLKQIETALASVNVVMPKTQAEFRAEVEARQKLGAAGAPALAMLFQVAGAFAQVVPQLEATADAARSAADILSERNDLQKQYDDLTLSEAEKRAKERAKVDPTNLDLFDQITRRTEINATTEALKTMFDSLKSNRQGILDFMHSLQMGSLSTLTPKQQYLEAEDHYAELLAQARANPADSAAQSAAQTAATEFVTASQTIYASSSAFVADRARVLGDMSALADIVGTQITESQQQLSLAGQQVTGLTTLNSTALGIQQAIVNLGTYSASGAAVFDATTYSAPGNSGGEVLVAEIRRLYGRLDDLVKVTEARRLDAKNQAADQLEATEGTAETIGAGLAKGLQGGKWTENNPTERPPR